MHEPQPLDINAEELAGILERVRPSITEAEFANLEGAIEMLVWLTREQGHKQSADPCRPTEEGTPRLCLERAGHDDARSSAAPP